MGEGAFFTRTDWARNGFLALVGIDPWPGTLNLVLEDAEARRIWHRIKAGGGLLLPAPEAKWCDARLFPACLDSGLSVAVVLPDIPDYPEDRLELIAAISLRQTLGLSDGDGLELSFCRATEGPDSKTRHGCTI